VSVLLWKSGMHKTPFFFFFFFFFFCCFLLCFLGKIFGFFLFFEVLVMISKNPFFFFFFFFFFQCSFSRRIWRNLMASCLIYDLVWSGQMLQSGVYIF